MSEADFPDVAFTFSAVPMFKTVSAIILSHQKKLIDPPASPTAFALERIYLFIQSAETCTLNKKDQEAKRSLSLPPKGTLWTCTARSKQEKFSGGPEGQQADGTTLSLHGNTPQCN